MWLVLLMYALFASVFTIGKTGLQYAQPFFLVGSRMAIAGLIMLAYLYITQRQTFKSVHFNKGLVWKIVCLSLFNIYLTNVFEFWGLQYLTTFKTCFIYSLSPFISALLSYFIFSEKLTGKKWLGLIVGFAGFLPILLNETTNEEQTGHLFMFSWAEIAVMAAACCSVYGWIILRQVVTGGCPPVLSNGLSMLVGGCMALIHSYFVENWNPIPVLSYAPVIECTLLLIVISNLICYNLYGHLLKRYTATFISFAGFTTPLFTALFGWLYLGETITMPFYLSALIVFCGLVVFHQEELRRGYTVKAPDPIPAGN